MAQTAATQTAAVQATAGKTKAEQRLEAMRAAGIDTTGYFAINESVVRVVNGVPEIVPDNAEITADLAEEMEEIAGGIVEGGEVFNRFLDGRWVLAQMLRMLHDDYTKTLNRFDYWYQWKMLLNHSNGSGELQRIYLRLAAGETGSEIECKTKFFNGNLVSQMITDYIGNLRIYFDSLEMHYCKGVAYKRLGKRYENLTGHRKGDLFVDDFNKFTERYTRLAVRAENLRHAEGTVGYYDDLMEVVGDFYRNAVFFPGDVEVDGHISHLKVCDAFKDAYKGNGAYFSANNLIRFHGLRTFSYGEKDSLGISMAKLNDELARDKGFQLLGFLRQLLADNGIDTAETVKLW